MPKIIPDAPLIKRAVNVHHHNTDESDGPRDI
jgi:hypothetical protein